MDRISGNTSAERRAPPQRRKEKSHTTQSTFRPRTRPSPGPLVAAAVHGRVQLPFSRSCGEEISHKKAQKSQKSKAFCCFCAFLWLILPFVWTAIIIGLCLLMDPTP